MCQWVKNILIHGVSDESKPSEQYVFYASLYNKYNIQFPDMQLPNESCSYECIYLLVGADILVLIWGSNEGQYVLVTSQGSITTCAYQIKMKKVLANGREVVVDIQLSTFFHSFYLHIAHGVLFATSIQVLFYFRIP